MKEPTCSFCGSALPKNQGVAGPKVFICRGCVEMCMEIFARDPEWRDQQIAKLQRLPADSTLSIIKRTPTKDSD